MSTKAPTKAPPASTSTKAVRARTKPKGQWHHGDLRSSLIAWGTHLLDTQGVEKMSMRAAAKLAGVSQGAPAHHFKDKNGLLAAIAAQGFRDMSALIKQRTVMVDNNDAAAGLHAGILAYVEFAQSHPARFHLMFGPLVEHRDAYPELIQTSTSSYNFLSKAVTQFLPEEVAGTEVKEQLAFAVWTATHGLATLAVHNRILPGSTELQPSMEQKVEIVVQFCLAALRNSLHR